MISEASLLLNNEVNVTSPRSKFYGRTGTVANVMADGRTLDVVLRPSHNDGFRRVLLDVTLVGEVRDTPTPPVGVGAEQSLGPDANSVLPENRL